jgi:hypothetical protein
MTLFIQNDAGGDGTGSVFPNQAELDLFLISKEDAQLGEKTLTSPADLIEVTYDQPAQTGFPPKRLAELVNTKFKDVPADPTDIIILAVDDSFLFTNNQSIKVPGGGATLPPKSSNEVGSALNPTESVLVIYDKDSCGSLEVGLVSKAFDLESPPPVTLFHELSHAFHFATNKALSTGASGCAASPEEKAAEEDENKMRAQMNLPLRDPTMHCSKPSNIILASCCIIASLATGSQSIELNSLRQIRERFLRSSEIGHDFFERLHYDYYAFSPQVCEQMSRDPRLSADIAAYYVRPLKECLGLAYAHLVEDIAPEEIGRRMVDSIPPELAQASRAQIEDAVAAIEAQGHVAPSAGGPALPRTPSQAAQSPYVRWALVRTIAIYLQAVSADKAGCSVVEIGAFMSASLDEWAGELPVTDVWSELSDYEALRELRFLQGLLKASAARERFAERLLSEGGDAPRFGALLASGGYLTDSAHIHSGVGA